MTLTFRNLFLLLIGIMFISSGCQRRDARKTSWRMARGMRGDFNASYKGDPRASNATNACGSYIPSNKSWGEVTMSGMNQNQFWYEVFYLTWPSLGGLDDSEQLGYVSGSSNQSTGIRLWGSVTTTGQVQGAVVSAKSQIRVEIYDDKACSQKSDGTIIPVIPIHIGANQAGFVGVTGTVNSGNTTITFTDEIGTLTLQGTFTGQIFQGTMRYSIPGHASTLGQFRVPTCSFFKC